MGGHKSPSCGGVIWAETELNKEENKPYEDPQAQLSSKREQQVQSPYVGNKLVSI